MCVKFYDRTHRGAFWGGAGGATELWDHPAVKEFFNFDSLDIGKSYAERAHAANAGNGVGHGLRYSTTLLDIRVCMYLRGLGLYRVSSSRNSFG